MKNKNIFRNLLIAVFTVVIFSSVDLNAIKADEVTYTGLGTAESPYLIYTKDEFNYVRNDLDAYYKLMNDIEFTESDFASGGDFYNGGAGFVPIGTSAAPFIGNFDGNGFGIKNLKIKSTTQEDSKVYAGLFGVSGGNILHLGVEGEISGIGSIVYAGGIVAYMQNGLIENCNFMGEIVPDATDREYAGGITAYQNNGPILKSYNLGNIKTNIDDDNNISYSGGICGYSNGNIIECYNTGDITMPIIEMFADVYFGGIAGLNQGGSILDCFNMGSISTYYLRGDRGEAYIGGICGQNLGNVERSYQAGIIYYESRSAEFYPIASFIGKNDGNVNAGYYIDYMESGINSGNTNGIKMLTPDEMNKASFYIGFDFDSAIWSIDMDGKYQYPQLVCNQLDSRFDMDQHIQIFSDGNLLNRTETLQFTCSVPLISWSIIDISGSATIDENGLLTGNKIGTVTVRATSANGSGIYAEKKITILSLPLSSIIVSSSSDTVKLTETLQMKAEMIPADADDVTCYWNVVNGTGKAYIDLDTGLLTPIKEGTVTVEAKSSNIVGKKTILILDPIKVSSIEITSEYDFVVEKGSLQMNCSISPSDANDKTVYWIVYDKTGYASIDDKGLLWGIKAGTVIVRAVANDGSEIYGEKEITVVPPLEAPTVNVVAGDSKMTLHWNTIEGATRYFIYLYDISNNIYTNIANTTSNTYTKLGLMNGKSYRYCVKAYNGLIYSIDSNYVTVMPIAAPVVIGRAGDGEATLSWKPVSGAIIYNIYLYDSIKKTYTSLANCNYFSYTQSYLINGSTYTYLVCASNGINKSAYTIADHVSVKPIATPAVTATAGDKTVTLKWNALLGATKYYIYTYNPSTKQYTAVTSTTSTSYVHCNLTNGTTYTYMVKAYNGVSYSQYSAHVTAKPMGSIAAPSASISADDGTAVIKWSKVADATQYRLYSYDPATKKYTKIATTNAQSTGYVKEGLKNEKSYYYAVTAYNGVYESNYSNIVIVKPIVAPKVTATAGDGKVTLTWFQVPGATNYRIFLYNSKLKTYTTVKSSITTTRYVISGLKNGTEYNYLVRAYNGVSWSASTTTKLAKVMPISAPKVKAIADHEKIILKWDKVFGATSYKVLLYNTLTGRYSLIEEGIKNTNYTLSNLKNGIAYTYLVRAYNNISWSTYTEADRVTAMPIAAPKVTATPGNATVTLKWSKVTGATSYKVLLYNAKTKSYTTVKSGITATSYTISGLKNGTSYTYLVRAYNGISWSAFTTANHVTATPKK